MSCVGSQLLLLMWEYTPAVARSSVFSENTRCQIFERKFLSLKHQLNVKKQNKNRTNHCVDQFKMAGSHQITTLGSEDEAQAT